MEINIIYLILTIIALVLAIIANKYDWKITKFF